MNMTDEQKYSVVLRELGEVLQNKNTTISCQQWQIEELQAKVIIAEEECAKAIEHAMALDQQLLDAMCEIEHLKAAEKMPNERECGLILTDLKEYKQC